MNMVTYQMPQNLFVRRAQTGDRHRIGPLRSKEKCDEGGSLLADKAMFFLVFDVQRSKLNVSFKA